MAGAFGQAWDILKREDYRQAGGTLIRDSEGRVLLVRRNELLPDGTLKPGGSFHGMYELPGGNVDPGETPQEGVARETLEETGLPLVNMTALEPNVYDDKRKVYHGFTADIDPSHEGDVQLSDEHEKYLWMHPHEALAMNEHPDGMDMPRWLSQDAITFFRGMVGGGDMQGEPMAKAWEFLKALPQSEIREAMSYSDEFEKKPSFKTANPIIERLIRERDEAKYRGKVDREGRSLAEHPGGYGLEGELPDWANPHQQVRQYGSDKGQPYTPMLTYSTEDLRALQSPYGEPAGYTNFGPTGIFDGMTIQESKEANAALGSVPGDRFMGDYVMPPDNKPSRMPMSRHGNFPYGARAGGHKGPMNVKPGSPMAQMYNLAPQLANLPEGLQPDWMSEFREE